MMPPGGFGFYHNGGIMGFGGSGGFNGGAFGFNGRAFGMAGGGMPPAHFFQYGQQGWMGPQMGGGPGPYTNLATATGPASVTWSLPTGRQGHSQAPPALGYHNGYLNLGSSGLQPWASYGDAYPIHLEPPDMERFALSLQSDKALQQRIWWEAQGGQLRDVGGSSGKSSGARSKELSAAPPQTLPVWHRDALLYRRPGFAAAGRLFTDLAAFAPGLNTTHADVRGVLEAEAGPDPADAPGTVESDARALIEGARAAGWRTITFPAAGSRPAWSIFFDGSGRYAFDRVLDSGLREQVVCDGKELLHLYPELGLASRRAVTRFHRAALADLVPWTLPPAKDLAHGFDVRSAGERTVAVLPGGLKADQPAVVQHLLFAADGRLAERRLVRMPKNQTLRRETYGEDGTVRILDADGKRLSEQKLALKAGGAPDLDPDTRDLVVLPLPLRTREHLVVQPAAQGGNIEMMDRTLLLALLAADTAVGNAASVDGMVRARFWNHGDTRPGLTTLLLSAGYDVNTLPLPGSGFAMPLGRYVARLRQPHSPEAKGDRRGDGLLRRLAEVQALLHRWQSPEPLTEADCAAVVKYVRGRPSPVFVWGIVQEVLRTPDQKVVAVGGRAKVQRDVLQAAAEALRDVPSLSYAARYECARHLAETGERTEARRQFAALYRETVKAGTLPTVDRGFREALSAQGQEPDLFADLLRETASGLEKDDRRVAVVALAWQCWELGAPALAGELLSRALDGITARERRLAPMLAALEYLWQTHQYDRADKVLGELLADESLAKSAGRWRMGYQLALQRKHMPRAFTCLAEALELEYRHNGDEIDLEAVRRDYGALLNHYAEVVRAAATLGQKPPADLAAKVVRAADRWRALDVDGAAACGAAYPSLTGLGKADLAWDYLLMSMRADMEGFSWANLAQSLAAGEEFDLAERAYAQACLADPGNADLRRARADNRMRAGHPGEVLPGR
jgi:hypothetical protein